ncbi:MAG: HDIG domain-containing metalloprotein [Desulfatibacillaceae bacterium]
MSNNAFTRDRALALVRENIANERTVNHCLASEAVMRALARHFGEDEQAWGIAGLVHDLDYEIVEEAEDRHGKVAGEMLEKAGAPAEVVNAVVKHNAEGLGLERSTRFEHALTCAETITGMIVATTLVYPDRKIASVKPKSVTKRMKTAHFARAVSRERIMECEAIGLPLAEFVALALEAMGGISDELGL